MSDKKDKKLGVLSETEVDLARKNINRIFRSPLVMRREISANSYKDQKGRIVMSSPALTKKFWNVDIGKLKKEDLKKYAALRELFTEPLVTRVRVKSETGVVDEHAAARGRRRDVERDLEAVDTMSSMDFVEGLQALKASKSQRKENVTSEHDMCEMVKKL